MTASAGILTALDVECPRCDVTVGQPCAYGRNGTSSGVHTARNVLAFKRQRGPESRDPVLGYEEKGTGYRKFRVIRVQDGQVAVAYSGSNKFVRNIPREDIDWDTVIGAWRRKKVGAA